LGHALVRRHLQSPHHLEQLNRYKEVVQEIVDHDSPKKILTRLAKLEDEITKGRKELEGLLK